MRLLEKSRYYSFWFVDLLKGGKIRSHYHDIKFILENYKSDKSKKLRDKHLNELLSHAVQNTSFYKSYSNFNSISDFPVIDKLMLRESFEGFISNKHKNQKSFKVSTSGSTGTPFVILQDN